MSEQERLTTHAIAREIWEGTARHLTNILNAQSGIVDRIADALATERIRADVASLNLVDERARAEQAEADNAALLAALEAARAALTRVSESLKKPWSSDILTLQNQIDAALTQLAAAGVGTEA